MFNNDIFENPYKQLTADGKLKFKNHNYASMLTNSLIGMFEYEKSDIYKDIDDATIERTLILNGTNGFWKSNNKVVCGVAYPSGALDSNGVGTLITGNLLNGKGFKGIRGVDAVCGYNNAQRKADTDIAKFADYLAECDTSQECAIRYSRNTPIYTVKNNKIKQMLKEAFKRVTKGEPITITDDSMTLTNKPTIEAINLTDVNSIDKLSYLNLYHAELLKRFFTMYGQALGEGNGVKLAQQSVAEVTANISNSFVLPLDRLKQRVKMCKELEEVFGGKISVRFTEPWRIEFEKWTNLSGNIENNIFNDDRKEGVDDDND